MEDTKINYLRLFKELVPLVGAALAAYYQFHSSVRDIYRENEITINQYMLENNSPLEEVADILEDH